MGKKNKSKAPKGRAAAKQKASRGAAGGRFASGMSRNGGRPQYGWSGDEDDGTQPVFRGFAQTNNTFSNSPRNFALRNGAVKLRHQAITFVSAGTNTPDEFLPKKEEQEVFVADEDSEDEEQEDAEDDFDKSTLQTNIVLETEIKMSETAFEHMKIESPKEANAERPGGKEKDVSIAETETPLFVVDTVGDPSLASKSSMKGKQPVRSPSPTPSNSSEEVVIFQGRNNPASAAPAANPPTRTKFKEVLTRAADGGYDARTTHLSNVRIETQEEQIAAAQAVMNRPKATNTQQQKPQPQPQTQNNQPPNQQSRAAPQQPQQQMPTQTAIGWGAREANFQAQVQPDATWAPAPAGSWWKQKGKKLRPHLDLPAAEKLAIEKARAPSKVMFVEPSASEAGPAATPGQPDSGEMDAEETIATLQAGVRSMQSSKRRARKATREQDDAGSKAPVAPSTPTRRGKRGRKKDNRQLRDTIDDDDEGDDSDAAFEDYMANLAAQQLDGSADDMFTKTAHAFTFGPALFVDGQAIEDDEVLPSHFHAMNNSDTSSEDPGPIGLDADEEISSDDEMDDIDLSNMESTELEDELEYTLQEQWEDEEDLRQRRRERMTDEQIARLFAKQQELGIDDDELILDNGEYVSMSEDVDGIGDIARARAGLADISNISFGRSNKYGMRRRNRGPGDFSFPDASALADTVEQYGENGFDIMDFDRPSLRPLKKGRKGNLPAELEALSDEELKEDMRTTWANDRRKKSAKKAEREELRMQGLLGAPGRAGKADLTQKYPFGMTTVQIHEELRIFLEDDGQQSRPFPPMGKNDRKELHEIASVLKLGSKSIGSGKDRYPVLTKTARTRYDSAILRRAIDASAKGFLGHGSKTARKLSRQGAKAAKSFGSTGAAQVRNGEVVGAGAAELGKENFGHRLMEKMGWSKGMGLGKEGEGRLEAVEQKVRLGTAGLG